jgi:ATP-dependent Clp protease ATP-binding subunit ClpX
MERKTGARALRAVMDELMMPMMFDLPELENDGVTYVIDGDAVEHPRSLSELKAPTKQSA